MANVYWSNTVSQNWDDIGNWFADNPPVTPYGSIPLAADDVVILGSTLIVTPPGTAITLSSFDSSQADASTSMGFAATVGVTATLITVGNATSNHGWGGITSGVTAVLICNGSGGWFPAQGMTVGTATFNNSTTYSPQAAIGTLPATTVTFNDTSTYDDTSGGGGGPLGGAISFNNSAAFQSGSIPGMQTVTFNGASTMTGGSIDTAIFNDSSTLNGGTVGTLATFNGSATQTGGTANAATFLGSSIASGGTTGTMGNAVSFGGGSALDGGTVGNGVTLSLDSTADMTGTVDGNSFTLQAGNRSTPVVEVQSTMINGTVLDAKIGQDGSVVFASTGTLDVTYASGGGGGGTPILQSGIIQGLGAI